MSTLLQIKKRAEELQKMYQESPTTNCFNVIIHGNPKSGKTHMLKTCRKPVLIHSFDPGGADVLRDEIEKGEIIVDSRFENEDPYAPSAFRLWKDEFNSLKKEGFFNHVGTYVIDSMTTWAQVIMYDVIREAVKKAPNKRSMGSQPYENDWLPQMQYIENHMRMFLALPCDCILLGHSELPTDRDGNVIGDLGLMVTGKLKKRLPALFSEIYYLRIKDFKSGERELLTQPDYCDGCKVMAGTRIGSGGKLNKYEKPDFKYLLNKVGMDASDKPLFKDLKDEE